VRAGDPLLTIHASDGDKLAAARRRLLAAYAWSEGDVEPPPLVYEVIC
jgi:thymidine phosphorylase